MIASVLSIVSLLVFIGSLIGLTYLIDLGFWTALFFSTLFAVFSQFAAVGLIMLGRDHRD